MRQEGNDLTISSPELSEADLLSAYIEHNRGNRSPSVPLGKNAPAPLLDKGHLKTFAPDRDHQHHSDDSRRQSFDQDINQSLFPTDLIAAIGLPSEYWLRHQSLPNIQEIGEEGSTSSPTGKTIPRLRVSLRRQNSDKASDRNKLAMTRQEAQDKSSPTKDVPPLPSPPPAVRPEVTHVKGTACEKRRKYSNTTGSSGSTSLGSGATVPMVPPSQRKYKKRTPGHPPRPPASTSGIKVPKQSSTESESGSYAVAPSFYIQMSEDDENKKLGWLKSSHSTSSSIASYASAKDMFGRPSLDLTCITIPRIVVMQTTPSSSKENLTGPGLSGRSDETAVDGSESSRTVSNGKASQSKSSKDTVI